jgi:hypothetical protein
MKPSPGNKVIFTDLLSDDSDYQQPICVTPKSLGVIVTLEEYIAEVQAETGRMIPLDELIAFCEKWGMYPIRLLKLEPWDGKLEEKYVFGEIRLYSGKNFRVQDESYGADANICFYKWSDSESRWILC